MLYYVQRHPYSIRGFSIMILQLSTRFAGADFWKNPTVFRLVLSHRPSNPAELNPHSGTENTTLISVLPD